MSFADELFTHAGEERTVRDWCALFNIKYNTVKSRHARGARTFEQVFQIKPVQLRRVEEFIAQKGEDALRQVDLLELLFNQSLREKILALAKAEYVANPVQGTTYSVRETLHELVRCGFIYKEKRMWEYEKALQADAEDFKLRHPDGLPEVTKGGGTIGWRTDEVRTQSRESPQRTWEPVTEQDIIDIFGE